MMKALLLAALIGLLHAEVVVKHLQVHEGATDYTQTVTLDFERNIQILEVPAHNNIVHSKTIFDFNQGVLFESHPETSTCFMKDIPQGVVTMDKFAAFLDKKTEAVVAKNQVTTRRAYKTTNKVTLHQMSSMAPEVVAECGRSTVYQMEQVPEEEIEISYRKAPNSLVDMFKGDGECHMPESCLWQTCQIGKDSCWWTVNCPDVTDDECNEYLEHSSIIHNCPTCQINCHPCYNMQCPDCPEHWEECRPTFDAAHGAGQCPKDPELGKDCGKIYCPRKADGPGETWNCPKDEGLRVEEGHTCVLMCDGVYGGMVSCNHDGTWDESQLLGCQ